MTPSIDPFFRHGVPVPLTASDYAVRARLDLPAAKSALQRLVYAGLVSSGRPNRRSLTVYDLTADALSEAARVKAEAAA